jgi:hypothetical protein
MNTSHRRNAALALALAAAALAAVPLESAQAESGCSVTGEYTVVGHAPREVGTYTGKVVISRAGEGCLVKWLPPNESQGTGDFRNGTLTVHYTYAGGQTGVVKYQQAPNGDLHGVWWTNDKPNAWGTESLLVIR